MTGGAGPKRKGAAWERRVRDAFRARGFDCERAYGAGRNDDVGDLHVFDVPLDVDLDCKSAARCERAEWLDRLRARSDGIPFLIEKRRSRDVLDAYVTTDVRGLLDLFDALRVLDVRRSRNGDQ
jgi:hypothetical protein